MRRPHLLRRRQEMLLTTAEEAAERQLAEDEASRRVALQRERMRRPGMSRRGRATGADKAILIVFGCVILPATLYALLHDLPGWDQVAAWWGWLSERTSSVVPLARGHL